MIAGAFSSKLLAQKDVTSQYITNPGFENCEAYTENIGGGDNVNASIDYTDNGWTNTSWASWSASAVVAAGGTGTVADVSAPSDGNGNMLGISVGWGGTITYKTGNVTLPKGYYLLKASAYNNNSGAAQFASKLGFITTGGTSFLSTVGSFPYQTWANDFVAFQITEDTEGYFQIGGQTVSGGSGANGKVFFDNLTLLYSEYPIDFTGKVGTSQASWNGSGSYSGNNVTLAEFYGSSDAGTKLYQEITGLTNGKYEATVYATSHNAWNNNGANLQEDASDVACIFATSGDQTKEEFFLAQRNSGYSSSDPRQVTISDIIVNDGNLTLGLSLKESGKTEWQTLQIKSLFCVDPSIDGIATAFTNGSEAEGEKWYRYEILSDGEYTITAGSDLSGFVYTTDGTILISAADQVNEDFTESMNLTAGTYYFKSATAQTLTFTPKSYSYQVGDGTSSIADGSCVKALTTWTINFPNANSDDPDAVFALIGEGKAQLKNGEDVVAEGTLNLDGTMLTATFDDVTLDNDASYTLVLPEGVVGFEGQAVNEAITIAITTPLVADGIYYLYDATGDLFLARGGAWGTEAVADKYGVPFNWKTDANGTGSIEFIDWPGVYLFITGTAVYTDNASTGWKFTIAPDGYYLCNADGTVYTTHDLGIYGEYVHTTEDASAATFWTLMSKEDHDAIVSTYPTDNKINVATAYGIDPDDFDTFLATLTPMDKTSEIGTTTFSGSAGDWSFSQVRGQDYQPAYGTNFCEAWNATGSWTQTVTGLPKGIYKLTVNGFERRTDNAKSYELGEQGYNLVSTNMVANWEQVRFASWFDAAESNYNPNNTGQAVAKFEAGEYLNELFVYVGDDGNLAITINKPNYTWDCWTLFNNFTLTYYAEPVEVTISSAGYTTLYYDKLNLVIPENVEVSTVSVSGTKITLNTVDAEVIPAGTGVVVKGAAGKYPFAVSDTEVEDKSAFDGNMLLGTDEETEIAEDGMKYYVLSLKKGGDATTIGFYFQVEGGASVTNGAHKAYLPLTAEQASNITGFDIETLTGISDMQLTRSDNGEAYSLSGVRMKSGNLPKGLYIIGGKKTVIK